MMITNFQLLGIVLLLTSCANSNISKIHNLGAPLAEVNSMLPASVPLMELEIRYSTSNNFVGEPISGYGAAKALLSIEAVQALSKVQIQLTKKGMGLKIFDAYRPQRAVDHFVRWATDIEDNAKKQQYYPNVKKSNLFREGYIAKQSGHSRGSSIDLTMIDLDSGTEIDMGSSWDFFDPISWPSSKAVTREQRANRKALQTIMLENGFRPLREEWWHFTLENEPFPNTYFDFSID